MAERPKRKAGVFDPWRQSAPPPPKPIYDLEHPAIPVEMDREPTATVAIKGRRYGIHVKVYGRFPTPAEEASAVLYEALAEMLRSKGTQKFFSEHGLFSTKRAHTTELHPSVHVKAPGLGPVAVTEQIAVALKAFMVLAKDAKAFLARKGVSVYLIT